MNQPSSPATTRALTYLNDIDSGLTLDITARKRLLAFLKEFERLNDEAGGLRSDSARAQRELAELREYVAHLKDALRLRSKDFGFGAEPNIDGMVLLNSLHELLGQERADHAATKEVAVAVEERLAACRRTLQDLLRSSQAAAQKLKTARDLNQSYEAFVASIAQYLGVAGPEGEERFARVLAQLQAFRDLSSFFAAVCADLNIEAGVPGSPGGPGVPAAREAVRRAVAELKAMVADLTGCYERLREENKDLLAVQEDLVATVAKQEELLDDAEPPAGPAQYAAALPRAGASYLSVSASASGASASGAPGAPREKELVMSRLVARVQELEDALRLERTRTERLEASGMAASINDVLSQQHAHAHAQQASQAPQAPAQRSAASASDSPLGLTSSVINTTRLAATDKSGVSHSARDRELADLAAAHAALQEAADALRADKQALEREVDGLHADATRLRTAADVLEASNRAYKAEVEQLVEENMLLAQRLAAGGGGVPAALAVRAAPGDAGAADQAYSALLRRLQESQLSEDDLRRQVRELRALLDTARSNLNDASAQNLSLAETLSSYEALVEGSMACVEQVACDGLADMEESRRNLVRKAAASTSEGGCATLGAPGASGDAQPDGADATDATDATDASAGMLAEELEPGEIQGSVITDPALALSLDNGSDDEEQRRAQSLEEAMSEFLDAPAFSVRPGAPPGGEPQRFGEDYDEQDDLAAHDLRHSSVPAPARAPHEPQKNVKFACAPAPDDEGEGREGSDGPDALAGKVAEIKRRLVDLGMSIPESLDRVMTTDMYSPKL